MPVETTIWDPVERLTSPEAEFAYLEAAFEAVPSAAQPPSKYLASELYGTPSKESNG